MSFWSWFNLIINVTFGIINLMVGLWVISLINLVVVAYILSHNVLFSGGDTYYVQNNDNRSVNWRIEE